MPLFVLKMLNNDRGVFCFICLPGFQSCRATRLRYSNPPHPPSPVCIINCPRHVHHGYECYSRCCAGKRRMTSRSSAEVLRRAATSDSQQLLSQGSG
ncbi:hypothetical protein I7I48_02534 [Histoplasma ohiense]|nr:hypothetical protein I7I48_02534 [Histoplasma ohiense (nom. inval.)]